MDKPSAHGRAHKVELFNHVVKEIENLESYYEAKVLAGGSTVNSTTTSVTWGSKPKSYHHKIYGQLADDSSSLSNGSYLYHDTPDSPIAGKFELQVGSTNFSERGQGIPVFNPEKGWLLVSLRQLALYLTVQTTSVPWTQTFVILCNMWVVGV